MTWKIERAERTPQNDTAADLASYNVIIRDDASGSRAFVRVEYLKTTQTDPLALKAAVCAAAGILHTPNDFCG